MNLNNEFEIVLKEFYSNGKPKFLYEEHKTDFDQLSVSTWYESGQKRKVVQYAHHNLFESKWFPNGQLMSEAEHLIDPITRNSYKEWNKKGQLISEYDDGDVLDIGIESESKEYYSNGQLSRHYKDRYLDDNGWEFQKEWYKNGQIKSKGFFGRNNYQRWFSNGQLQYMSFINESKTRIIKRSWYSNNQIRSYQEFKYDSKLDSKLYQKVGTHKFWDKDGNIISQKIYQKEDKSEINNNSYDLSIY